MKRAVYDCKRAYAILQSYDDVIDISLTDLERTLCPALIEKVGCALGRGHENLAILADVIMCLYLSDVLHSQHEALRHKEPEPSEAVNVKRQYAVLVGDYWLSEAFHLLISQELFTQISLRRLTKLVRTMKLGALQRRRLTQNGPEPDGFPAIWEMERGALLAQCGKLAADILGADASIAALFERFGRCLGMAWAAFLEAEEYGTPDPRPFLAEADAVIDELASVADVAPLIELKAYLEDQVTRQDKALGFVLESV